MSDEYKKGWEDAMIAAADLPNMFNQWDSLRDEYL